MHVSEGAQKRGLNSVRRCNGKKVRTCAWKTKSETTRLSGQNPIKLYRPFLNNNKCCQFPLLLEPMQFKNRPVLSWAGLDLILLEPSRRLMARMIGLAAEAGSPWRAAFFRCRILPCGSSPTPLPSPHPEAAALSDGSGAVMLPCVRGQASRSGSLIRRLPLGGPDPANTRWSAALPGPGDQNGPDAPGGVSFDTSLQTEGLIGSILRLLGLDLAVSGHSTLRRRAETLEVPRPISRARPVHLLIDSTGLPQCGAGEWRVTKR